MNKSILCAIRHAVRAAPTVVLATGVFCPVALADPGDLVPDFGDVGRVVLPGEFHGPAQFVELQDDDAIFGGGETVETYYCGPCGGHEGNSWSEYSTHGFAGRLSIGGTLDTGFETPGIADIHVVGAAIQPDQKIVGIGRRILNVYDGVYANLVFRLEPDGALDASFGEAGVRELADIWLSSVALDPGGTIVVAGWLGSDLRIVRLLANGDLDDTFGTAGVFTAAADSPDEGVLSAPRILSAQDGGYRITDNDYVSSGVSRCRVLGLTATGAVDESFGDHGYTRLAAPSGSIGCNSMTELPDGRLLVAGSEGNKPLIVRLLKSGAADATFVADDLAHTTMTAASALAVDPNTGAIAIAGFGPDTVVGSPVARLQPDGSLDQQFGTGGTTWIDMPGGNNGPILDMAVLPDGDVLVAGGPGYLVAVPSVARLAGGDANDSPGVVGVSNRYLERSEDDQQAILTVRRMGGTSGSVSVAYAARGVGDSFRRATEGEDFTATSGRLEWADGDSSDKQIVVPIAPDGGSPEEAEGFEVELNDAQGGAGLGTVVTSVSIKSDAPAAGMLSIQSINSQVDEAVDVDEADDVYVEIARGYSSVGAVSVTLTLTPDTATGDDFEGGVLEPVTVTWADGDADLKGVLIPIVDDSNDESAEGFSLQLTDPTGGAVVGPRSTGSITIEDNDSQSSSGGGSGGGGGRTGLLSLLLLAVANWVRARVRA